MALRFSAIWHMLLRGGVIFALLSVAGFVYGFLHTWMVPRIGWLEALATAICSTSSVKGTDEHSPVVYYFFLAPFVAGALAWCIAIVRRQRPAWPQLVRGWFGAWVGWGAAVWFTQQCGLPGYLRCGPYLWTMVLAGGPPLMPSTAYLLALFASALGATTFVMGRRVELQLFLLGLALWYAGAIFYGMRTLILLKHLGIDL